MWVSSCLEKLKCLVNKRRRHLTLLTREPVRNRMLQIRPNVRRYDSCSTRLGIYRKSWRRVRNRLSFPTFSRSAWHLSTFVIVICFVSNNTASVTSSHRPWRVGPINVRLHQRFPAACETLRRTRTKVDSSSAGADDRVENQKGMSSPMLSLLFGTL